MSDKPIVHNRGRFQLKYRGTECMNCGHPLDISDRYCPNCSQPNTTKKVSIKDFLDEYFSNAISYDSRLFRTLSAMILRPGTISKDYVEGKRMRYTNPFRFMLSLAIIYFLLAGLSGNFSDLDRYGENSNLISFNNLNALDLALDENQAERQEAEKVLDSLQIREKISSLGHRRDSVILADPGAYFQTIPNQAGGMIERLGMKYNYFTTLFQKDSLNTFQEAIDRYRVASSMENKMAFNMAQSTLRVMRQPGSFVNDLIAKLPFATFFFLPIFALFIVLVYIRKKYTYTDNLIFSFHNQSLLFILLIVSFLIDAVFEVDTAWIALTVFSVYLYQAMRNFYGQSHFKTILKYLFLNAIFFILAGIAGIIFILTSAFTY